MRTLFGRLGVWALATAAICILGFSYTENFRKLSSTGADFLSKFLEFQTAEARRAYVEDGKPGLRDFFTQLRNHFPGKYALLDETGHDVLTREDRSHDIRDASLPGLWRSGVDRVNIIWPDRDRRYYLAVEAAFPAGPPPRVPFYIWLLVAGIGFCLIPVFQIAAPLRTLSHAVERFGSGQLDARIDGHNSALQGNDELGKLGRSFNRMADRIQTLLTAERRLLLDVSHELRSPLARLKFAVQLAHTSPDRQQSLRRIERDIDRLTVLVSELLHVTRAESDPGARTSDTVHLNGLLAELAEAGSFESSARCCRLQLTDPEPVFVEGDRELIHRAIENVLRNAMRFTPDGSHVEITLSRDPGDQAMITVRDHGPGVPDDAIAALFEPFFRVEADRNRMGGGGFGLGLSIAQRAVSVHGGTISAENANPGLRVQIRLPRVIAAPATLAESQSATLGTFAANLKAGAGR